VWDKNDEQFGECSPEVLNETDDSLSFIQTCMKTGPSSKELMEVIEAAKESNRCDVMQRLYAYKAQAGDPDIALAYAREYDPEYFEPYGCVDSADIETAVYWYELAVLNGVEDVSALERLQKLRD
jgi:hypothetical protein